MEYRLMLRSHSGRRNFVFFVVAAVIFVVVVAISDGPKQLLFSFPFPYAILVWGWWAGIWPACELSSEGVLVRNMFRTVAIPWRALKAVKPHLGLYLEAQVQAHDVQRFYVSAVPARGGFRSAKKANEGLPDFNFDRSPVPSVSVGPGVAARLIENEQFYLANPASRPELASSALTSLAAHQEAHRHQVPLFPAALEVKKYATVRWNYAQIALGVSAILAVVIRIIWL